MQMGECVSVCRNEAVAENDDVIICMAHTQGTLEGHLWAMSLPKAIGTKAASSRKVLTNSVATQYPSFLFAASHAALHDDVPDSD